MGRGGKVQKQWIPVAQDSAMKTIRQQILKQLEDRSQKKKIMFLHSKNKASRKGYKGEC